MILKYVLNEALFKKLRFEYQSASRKAQGVFIHKFEGIIHNLERRYKQTDSAGIRNWIEGFMSVLPCPACGGARLKKESLSIKVADKNINDVTRFSVKLAEAFFQNLTLSERDRTIARQILTEIESHWPSIRMPSFILTT